LQITRTLERIVLSKLGAFLCLLAAAIIAVVQALNQFGPDRTIFNAVAVMKKLNNPDVYPSGPSVTIWGWWSVDYPGHLKVGDHKPISVTYTPTSERHQEGEWPETMDVTFEAPGLTVETTPHTFSFKKAIDAWNDEWNKEIPQTNFPETHSWTVTPPESALGGPPESALGGHTVTLKFNIQPDRFRNEKLIVKDADQQNASEINQFIPTEASLIVSTVNELGFGRPVVIAWNQILKVSVFLLSLPAFTLVLKWFLERMAATRRRATSGRSRA
jgi:hypothetical protein